MLGELACQGSSASHVLFDGKEQAVAGQLGGFCRDPVDEQVHHRPTVLPVHCSSQGGVRVGVPVAQRWQDARQRPGGCCQLPHEGMSGGRSEAGGSGCGGGVLEPSSLPHCRPCWSGRSPQPK